jgi:hypothetical protein
VIRRVPLADLRELGDVLVIVSVYGLAGVTVAFWIGVAIRVVLWAAGFR